MSSKARIIGVVIAGATALASFGAFAQNYPDRPINLVVGLAPGSAVDALARQYSVRLEQALNSPVVVQNRPGAGHLLAVSNLVNASPDGYTLALLVGSTLSQSPALRDDLPYETMVDFVPVALLASASGIFAINNELPVNDMGELIEYARENPGVLNFGSSGVGTASHLQMELLMYLVDVDMVHIPYDGTSQVLIGTMGGEVDIGIGPIDGALESVRSGQLRGLAVTGEERSPLLPDVPALGELGVPELAALDPYSYYMIVAPRDTPQDIIDMLNRTINEVSQSSEIEGYLISRGFAPVIATPDEARDFVLENLQLWADFRENTGFEFAAQ